MAEEDDYSALMSVNMEAFMELESRLNDQSSGSRKLISSEPMRPRDKDCCNQACNNCVWLVYADECRHFSAYQAGLAPWS